MRVSKILLAMGLALGAAGSAGATNFSVVAGTTRSLVIASYGPVGESFVATDGLLNSLGFQFSTLNAGSPNADVTLTLRAGDGPDGAVVATRTATLPLIAGRTPTWFDFDLGSTALTVGASYTALLSTTSNRLAVSYGANAAAVDAYAGGALIAGRAVTDCGAGVACDANFRFTATAVSAAVPEAASWAMMLAGFGAIGAAARRGRRTVVASAG